MRARSWTGSVCVAAPVLGFDGGGVQPPAQRVYIPRALGPSAGAAAAPASTPPKILCRPCDAVRHAPHHVKLPLRPLFVDET